MKKTNMIIVGKRIRQARVLAGLTQEQLAEKIGVSRTAVVRWETAETEPTLEHLLALSNLLKVSADYLLGIDEHNQVLDRLMDLTSKIYRVVTELKEGKEK